MPKKHKKSNLSSVRHDTNNYTGENSDKDIPDTQNSSIKLPSKQQNVNQQCPVKSTANSTHEVINHEKGNSEKIGPDKSALSKNIPLDKFEDEVKNLTKKINKLLYFLSIICVGGFSVIVSIKRETFYLYLISPLSVGNSFHVPFLNTNVNQFLFFLFIPVITFIISILLFETIKKQLKVINSHKDKIKLIDYLNPHFILSILHGNHWITQNVSNQDVNISYTYKISKVIKFIGCIIFVFYFAPLFSFYIAVIFMRFESFVWSLILNIFVILFFIISSRYLLISLSDNKKTKICIKYGIVILLLIMFVYFSSETYDLSKEIKIWQNIELSETNIKKKASLSHKIISKGNILSWTLANFSMKNIIVQNTRMKDIKIKDEINCNSLEIVADTLDNITIDNLRLDSINISKTEIKDTKVKNAFVTNLTMDSSSVSESRISISSNNLTFRKTQFNNDTLSFSNAYFLKFDSCDFSNCVLEPLILKNTTFSTVKFIKCKIHKWEVSESETEVPLFKNVKFDNCTLINNNFGETILDDVYFVTCSILNNDFSLTKIKDIYVYNSTFDNCIFDQTNFNSATTKEPNNVFTHSDFINCTLTRTTFSNQKLVSCTFDSVYFNRAIFLHSDLNDIIFKKNSTIKNSKFDQCVLDITVNDSTNSFKIIPITAENSNKNKGIFSKTDLF